MKYIKGKLSAVSWVLGFTIIIFTVLLLYQYFISGVYNWHIQKAGNQLSIVYVLSVLGIAFCFKPGFINNVILVGLILTYAIFAGVLGSLILVIYYLLAFYLLGLKYSGLGLAIQFSYGVLFFLILRSGLSIFLGDLIISEVLFIILVLSFSLPIIKSKKSFADINLNSALIIDIKIVFLVFALITVGLNIATNSYDHDSLWYPLRSNALYFNGNFFSDNGFYGQVHFYPKLWESLTNNIFIDYNYSYGLSLCASLYIVITVIIYRLFDKNKIINTLIIVTTPVVIGLSFSLKTDLLVLTVFLIAFIGIERRRYDIVISALLLSFCIKNNVFLLIVPMLVYMYFYNKKNVVYKNSMPKNNMVILFAFIVFTLFFYRTYHLTGLPVSSPNLLIHTQELFGFEFRIPMRTIINRHEGVFEIYKMIIFPEDLATHRFYYNGYLWVASLFTFDIFVAIFILPIFVIAYSVTGIGDGNYYSVLTVILTVLFLRKIRIEKIGYVLIVSNIIISVVANPNWVVPKIPSIKHICFTVFCSDKNNISSQANYLNLTELQNIINDKSKRYFVISNDKPQVFWKLFHRYNVSHITEFSTWNHLIPMYSLKDYIDKHIDFIIIDNNYSYNARHSELDIEHSKFDIEYVYNQKGELPGFDSIAVGEKYTIYRKNSG